MRISQRWRSLKVPIKGKKIKLADLRHFHYLFVWPVFRWRLLLSRDASVHARLFASDPATSFRNILTEIDQPFELDTLVAARLRRAPAVRIKVGVPQRVEETGGPTGRVNHVHEPRVLFVQTLLVEFGELETWSSGIETCARALTVSHTCPKNGFVNSMTRVFSWINNNIIRKLLH